MKIVQLVESLDIGGLPNYVLQLAKLLADAGNDVTIGYVRGTPGAHLELSGLNVVSIPDVESLKKMSPDIVHIHLLSDIDFLSALEKSNLRVIRSFHDYTSTCLRRGKRRFRGDRCQRALGYGCAAFGCLIAPPLPDSGSRLPRLANLPEKISERDIYRRFDAAICGSHHMRDMLLKNGFDGNSVYRIPYFSKFADEAAKPATKETGAGKSRPFEFLFSGQAVSGKGLEILIEALAGLKGNWSLTVFSEGARLPHAKEKAAALGLADKITFNGWVEQSALRAAYKKADLFILPSIWDDPGPLVGIEALACGTPVAGFAVGGIPDYVLDGQTGFLVKDVSVQGLHKALQTALGDTQNVAKMSKACQELVTQHHGAETHLQNIQNVYKAVTTQKRTGTR